MIKFQQVPPITLERYCLFVTLQLVYVCVDVDFDIDVDRTLFGI